MQAQTALIIGASDGIGLALARRLVASGYEVCGLSRSPSPLSSANYHHYLCDVASAEFEATLDAIRLKFQGLDRVVYCAGIAHRSDTATLALDHEVFAVNLQGAVRAAAKLIPHLVACERGRLVVVSSQADLIVNPEAPSYTASKAALSLYFEGLALRYRASAFRISNVRFGFVETKLARSGLQPFRISADVAAKHLHRLLEAKRPKLRVTLPNRVRPIVRFARLFQALRVACA